MPINEVTNGTRAIVKVGRNEIEVIVLEATEHGWTVRAVTSGREFAVREIIRVLEEPAIHLDPATGDLEPLGEATPNEPEEEAAVEADAEVGEEPTEPTAEPSAPAVEAEAAPVQGARPMSLLKAAAKVLAESDEPMRISEIYDAIKAQNLWVPVNGRTPELSLYSGIYREIKTKGENARFRKLDRGLYTTRR